jgi:uncharacterized membrane protein
MIGTWRQSLPLLLILLLALGLRLVNLQSRPVWYDEAFSILYAQGSAADILAGTLGGSDATAFTGANAAAEEHPLLYYAGLHGWQNVLGSKPAGARSFSVLAGVLAVLVVYLLTRRLFDHQTALGAAFLAAVAPFAVYYSQEARMYTLLGLLAISSLYFLVRALQAPAWFNWIAFALVTAAMLYTHNLALFFLAALDLWLLVVVLDRRWRTADGRWQTGVGGQRSAVSGRLSPVSGPRSLVSKIIAAHALILLLYLPWLLVLPRQLGKLNQAYWVSRPGITELIQTLLIFHFGYDNQALPSWLLPLALFFSLLIPVLLILVLRRHRPVAPSASAEKAGPLPLRLTLLLLLAVGPPLLAFLVSQVRPVYVVRAFLPSALVYYVLVAYGFVRGGMPRPVKWGVAIPALAIVAVSLVNHYGYRQFPRPPFAAAMTYLGEAAPGRIVHSNKLTYLPAYYYAPELAQQFIADEPGSASDTLSEATQAVLGIQETADIETATVGAERVWLVIFQNAVAEFADTGREHPHLSWLNAHYQQQQIQQFDDLLVIEFQRAP